MDLSRLACKILERVRDFRSNFTWETAKAPPVKKKPAAKAAAGKVYARQPSKTSKPSPKRTPSKAKSSKGRSTVKK